MIEPARELMQRSLPNSWNLDSAGARTGPANMQMPTTKTPPNTDLADNVRANIETARLFQELRFVLDLSASDVAQRIGTTPDVIDALETGRISGLPAWPETATIVTAYTGLAGIDPRPVLHTLESQLAAITPEPFPIQQPDPGLAPETQSPRPVFSQPFAQALAYVFNRAPKQATAANPPLGQASLTLGPGLNNRLSPYMGFVEAGTDAPVAENSAAPINRPSLAERLSPFFSRFRQLIAALFVPRLGRLAYLLIPLLALTLPATNSHVLSATTSVVPAPLASALRDLHKFVLIRTATRRDGLLWIEVSNPDALRGDKLPTGKR